MTTEGILNDTGSLLVSKLMEVAQERQGVLANNLANANTPEYIRLELDFKTELARIVRQQELSTLPDFRPETIEDYSQSPQPDGNNIVVPTEINAMMENSIMYNLLARAFSTRMGILRAAIDGGNM